jgi:hypothetical protein
MPPPVEPERRRARGARTQPRPRRRAHLRSRCDHRARARSPARSRDRAHCRRSHPDGRRERLEDPLTVGWCDSRPLVGHAHLDGRTPGGDCDRDLAPRGREADRVLEQVRNHLVDQDGVNGDIRRVPEDRAHPDRAQCGFEPMQDRFHDLVQGGGLLHGNQRARPDLRQAEDVAHQPVQAVGLLEHRLQQLARLRLVEPHVDLQQAGDGGLDRGERCPKVVRDGREQCRTRLAGLRLEPGIGDLSVEAGAFEVGRDLAGGRLQEAPILRGGFVPTLGRRGQRAERVLPARDRKLGSTRLRGPRTGSTHVVGAAGSFGMDGAARQSQGIDERGGQIVQYALERFARQGLGREQVEEPRLALAAGRSVAFGDGTRHHPPDQHRHDEEHDERDDVVPVVDPKRVQRLREEVVEEQEPQQRAADAGPQAAEHGGRDHGEHEQRGCPELALGLNDQGQAEREPRREHGEHRCADARPRAGRETPPLAHAVTLRLRYGFFTPPLGPFTGRLRLRADAVG